MINLQLMWTSTICHSNNSRWENFSRWNVVCGYTFWWCSFELFSHSYTFTSQDLNKTFKEVSVTMTQKPMPSNMFDAYLMLTCTADKFTFCTYRIGNVAFSLSKCLRWNVFATVNQVYHQLTLVMLHGNCDLYVTYNPHKILQTQRLGSFFSSLRQTNIGITTAAALVKFQENWLNDPNHYQGHKMAKILLFLFHSLSRPSTVSIRFSFTLFPFFSFL